MIREYYHDTWFEDGDAPIGYRKTGWFKPVPAVPRKFADIRQGDSLPAKTVGPITRTDIVKYAGASWDFNPVHHDEPFARRARSGGIIAHGMMTLGHLASLVSAHLGTVAFDKYSGRLVEVTRAGDSLRLEGKVTSVIPAAAGGGQVVIAVTATKQSGEVVAQGVITTTLAA